MRVPLHASQTMRVSERMMNSVTWLQSRQRYSKIGMEDPFPWVDVWLFAEWTACILFRARLPNGQCGCCLQFDC